VFTGRCCVSFNAIITVTSHQAYHIRTVSTNVGFYSAAALLATQSAVHVLATAIPSVCPSHSGTLSRRMNVGSRDLHCEVVKTLYSFLIRTMAGERRPLYLKFALKVPAPFEKRRLRPIFAYNVSTVRGREKLPKF